MTHYIGLEIVA